MNVQPLRPSFRNGGGSRPAWSPSIPTGRRPRTSRRATARSLRTTAPTTCRTCRRTERAHPGDQLRAGLSVNVLQQGRLSRVAGIDSDPAKVEHARRRGLPCEVAEAFPYLERSRGEFDVIIPEQELNHLTHQETIEFLQLCHAALRRAAASIVYAMNGANPFVGAENLAHNIDHFYIVTEYSLTQLLELGGFRQVGRSR